MVTARSAAMAFNRWADASLDAANREPPHARFPQACSAEARAAALPLLCLYSLCFGGGSIEPRHSPAFSRGSGGAPVLLLHLRDLPAGSHLVLGLALGIAPAAAWIAIRGSLDPRIVVLTAVLVAVLGGGIRCSLRLPGHGPTTGEIRL